MVTTYTLFERNSGKSDRTFLVCSVLYAQPCSTHPSNKQKHPNQTLHQNMQKNFRFDYVVLDEGHCMKNPCVCKRKSLPERNKTVHLFLLCSNTSRYQRLAKLKFKRRLLLSGTPIQVCSITACCCLCSPGSWAESNVYLFVLLTRIIWVNYSPFSCSSCLQ